MTNGVVLISGGGSNLQSIIDQANSIGLNISAVISNQAQAYGLQRAEQAGIEARVIDHTQYNSREDFDTELRKIIDSYEAELVILAGFMRILTPEFTQHYTGRMLNIHPSLLPKFQGLHTHQRAIDAGETEHGASVHFVTAQLDGGPVIAQRKVKILPGDDAKTLAARVLTEEHKLYPQVIEYFCDGRLKFDDNHAFLDGEKICV